MLKQAIIFTYLFMEELKKKQNLRLLLVDDSDLDLFISSRMLKSVAPGAEIITMLSSQEALVYLEQCHRENQYPALLLLDVNMPGLTGPELLKKCLEANVIPNATMQVVMLSSSTSDIDRQQSSTYGAGNYLEKPLTPEKIATFLPQTVAG